MLDLKLIEDGESGEFDLEIAPGGDIASVNDFSTSLLTSLLTDRRASQEQVVVPQFRRGWIGDAAPALAGYELGSHLWLIEPSKATQQTMVLAASQARAALQWMLDQRVAVDIQVNGQITGPRQGRLTIEITAPDGRTQTQFLDLWENTTFLPSTLPPPILEPAPFDPLTVEGLVVLGDADRSDHNIDENCGTIFQQDLAGVADYGQANADRRPLRIRGSTGWLYRFDGVDDFLATANSVFPFLAEGTAFFIYKPIGTVNPGDRFFSLGANGFADNQAGLAFIQGNNDTIQVLAANDTFDVSVTGPATNDLPAGVLVRWGPGSAGAEIEVGNGNSNVDPEYDENITSINQIVFGAGFDGSGPDVNTAASFECSIFAFYSRRVSDLEVFQFLEYAASRPFPSPVGEPADDCFYFTDDFGFA